MQYFSFTYQFSKFPVIHWLIVKLGKVLSKEAIKCTYGGRDIGRYQLLTKIEGGKSAANLDSILFDTRNWTYLEINNTGYIHCFYSTTILLSWLYHSCYFIVLLYYTMIFSSSICLYCTAQLPCLSRNIALYISLTKQYNILLHLDCNKLYSYHLYFWPNHVCRSN